MSTPKRPSRPRDPNQLAHAVFLESVGGRSAPIPLDPADDAGTTDDPGPAPDPTPDKNPHAVALAKLGAAKGGKARTDAMTPEERKELARKAAKARWEKNSSK